MKPVTSVVKCVARTLARLVANQRGATAVEYGLILAFMVVALIFGLSNLGIATSGMWDRVSTKVQNAH